MKTNRKILFNFSLRNLGLALIIAIGCGALTYFASKYFPSLSNSITATIIIFVILLLYLRGSIYQTSIQNTLNLNEARLKLGNLGSSSPLPWTNFSTNPIIICELIENASLPQIGNIIECGSGISTLYLASIIKSKGNGHVYSIEDDPKWADITHTYLKQCNLENYCTIVVAPLKDIEIDGLKTKWYDIFQNELNIPTESCGLLYVDGPKGKGENDLRRYPAIPQLKNYLKSGSKVFLDDADRKGESIISEKWEQIYKLKKANTITSSRHRQWIFN